MKIFFDAVIKANQEIEQLLQTRLEEELFQPTTKGAGGDISLKIDLLAEDIFIKYLSSFGNINSEEKGYISKNNEYDIIIDPIDGSDNLVTHVPYFGTSVAFSCKGKILAGVIVNLANKDIFIKDDKGMQKAKLDVLDFQKIEKNPYAKLGLFERAYRSLDLAKVLNENKIKYRSPGAFALSLAYAHEVDFVLYEGKRRVYDIAAGEYFCDDLYQLKTDNILLVSKNKETFDKMSKFILRDQ